MSKTRQNDLMVELDRTALALLKEHFPAPPKEGEQNLQPEAPADPTVKIKAFAAVVNYYGPRTKLGGDEDSGKSEFEGLRGKLHGSGRRRAHRGGAGGAQGLANGAAADHPSGDPADAGGST